MYACYHMSTQSAYFIQYHTCFDQPDKQSTPNAEGLATVIVFAENKCQALSRAGKLIAKEDLQISGFLKMSVLQERNQQMFCAVLKSLFRRAELYGAALHLDPFPSRHHCCR